VLKVDFNGDITTAEGATVGEFGGQTNSYPTIASITNPSAYGASTSDIDRMINITVADVDSGDTLAITVSS